MQTLLVALAIAAAVGYAVWRTCQTFNRASDPCCGCEGCQLKELRERAKAQGKCKKEDCPMKK